MTPFGVKLTCVFHLLSLSIIASNALHSQRNKVDSGISNIKVPRAIYLQMSNDHGTEKQVNEGSHGDAVEEENDDDAVGMNSKGHLSPYDDMETHEGDVVNNDEGNVEDSNHKGEVSQEGDDDSVIDNIAREEAMRDMHKKADEMKQTAMHMQNAGIQHAKESKEATEEISQSTTSVPKELGNIIITNTTKAEKKDPKAEAVDPIKALSIATANLYERARRKGIPVDGSGELSTPEQIYQALNKLEYIIDGFRHSQLESPNPDLNITEDTGEKPESQKAETGSMPPRFLQSRQMTKGQGEDDDDNVDDDDGDVDHDDGDDNDGDENEDGDVDNEDGDDNEDSDNKEDANGNDKGATAEESEGSGHHPTKQKMTKEEAIHALEATITELVQALNKVVTANTGIGNVLIHHKGDMKQIKEPTNR